MSDLNQYKTEYPKITIITPNFNMGDWIEQTILSVISQNYPNLEYIIIDGGSTDNSVEIIKKYESQLGFWSSEPDDGLYHAVQKGFDRSTGEIMGWLNSDDMLHPNSLFLLGEIFSEFEKVEWVTGHPTLFNESGITCRALSVTRWQQYHLYLKNQGFIPQESTFWRRNLWEKAGSTLDLNLKLAADFELWVRFFEYAQIYCTGALTGGFRIRGSNQLSDKYRSEYEKEIRSVLSRTKLKKPLRFKLKIAVIRLIYGLIKPLKKISFLFGSLVENKISKILGAPPLIQYDFNTDKFILTK